jgi:hypothetical protein
MKTPTLLLSAMLSLLAWLAVSPALETADQPTPEQLDFFEKKIRPVLSEHCYKCHSEKSEKIRGGLVLDTREGIRRGGDNGPAVVPGELKESLLIEAIHHTNKDFAMPPEKEGPKLADAVIKDFEAWVKMGAPDPRDGPAKVVAKYDDAAARKWWSFQPIAKPGVPTPKNAAWPKSDIDRFLLAALEAKGLQPVADADRATLLRRVYFDLIGLPPSPKEIDAFLKDQAPDAFEKVVDRLLASPQFGERWGRHWLDVARYAESTGKDVNVAFPHAWRYRDYVIGAFNADKPFDQFIKEQIAGDLLTAKDDRDQADKLIATGFLALGPKGLNEQNPRQFAMDVADEQIDTVSQAVLGLTVACARCHDHKFDPVSQREYYALAGIFLSTESRYGTAFGIQNRHASELHELPKGAGLSVIAKPLSEEARARMHEQLEDLREDLPPALGGTMRPGRDPRPGGATDAADQLRRLRAVGEAGAIRLELASYEQDGTPKALAMGVRDRTSAGYGTFFGDRSREDLRARFARRPGAGGFPGAMTPFPTVTDSPLFARGEVDKPGEKVPRGFPAVLTLSTPPPISRHTSGRLELAEWLVTPTNPLTARVMVNRVWHWLFGQGLVESVDNFGTTGQKPSNPALLDYLASEFVGDGWSVKRLIKDIVMSRAYQLSSTHDARAFAADPENTLVWRMNQRRLDAECVRDAMLAASGQLDLTPQVGTVIARAGDGPIGGPRIRGVGEEAILHAGGVMRSVYLPVARDVVPDALAVFDFAETSLVTGARETTNVPSQALYLLNSTFVSMQAQALADRILKSHPGGPNGGVSASFDQRLAEAYRLVFARGPDAAERKAAAAFFAKFPSNWKKGDNAPMGMRDADDVKAAWTSFSRALFASAEFRYLN